MTQHVIIGGGPAATYAIQTIRQYDTDGAITLLCDEPAHSRMALPYWIADQIPRDRVLTGNEALWRQQNVAAHMSARVRAIQPVQKQVETEGGQQFHYDRLLIATGSRPRTLRVPGMEGDRVQPLWNLHHVTSLLDSLAHNPKPRVAMIGAGFIGFIVLNAMYKRGWTLSVIEREAHVLPRMLNAPAAQLVEHWLAERQVDVRCGREVQAIEDASDGSKRIVLHDGTTVEADLVIVATGVQPNLELATPAGIATDQGILVDAEMRTNVPDIFAAGDVAQGPVLHSSAREIHAIQPTAVDHGRIAGANMAGHQVSYPGSLSMNVLDVCGLQCVSYGEWDGAGGGPLEMSNTTPPIYRNIFWSEDRFRGAIFVARANDVGMLTDAGMVKGFLQTNTSLGPWKKFLEENPFDLRRPFIATGVPEKLRATTLLGSPSATPAYRVMNPETDRPQRPHLETFRTMLETMNPPSES